MANEELKIRNLNRVLQTAYEQMLNHGIENTTQVMLAKASGISKASIDRYFVNKADCVIQTAEMIAKRASDYLWEQINLNDYQNQSGIEKLYTYMEIVKKIYVNNPRIFVLLTELKVYLYRNCSNTTEAYIRFSEALRDRPLLEKIITLSINDGSVKPDLNVVDTAVYISKFYRELLTDFAMCPNPGAYEIMEKIDRFIATVLKMVRSKD